MQNKKVSELMESDLAMISPDATLTEAAIKMKERGCGFLPVGSDDRAEGIITDRDIVIRAICNGSDPQKSTVRDCMSTQVCACSETDSLQEVAQKMNDFQVSRLVVTDDSGRLRGVLSFGHIVRNCGDREATHEVVERATGKKAA